MGSANPVHRPNAGAHGGFAGHRQQQHHPHTESHINPAAVGFEVQQPLLDRDAQFAECSAGFERTYVQWLLLSADTRNYIFNHVSFYFA